VALPELIAAQADRALTAYCEERVPAHARSQIRLEHRRQGDTVTLVVCRPGRDDAAAEWTVTPIARFKYDRTAGTWTLWCADRNDRWHLYEYATPTKRLDPLLEAVERDQTGIFWG